MLYQVIVATILVSISVALHAIGMVALFDRLVRFSLRFEQRVGTAGELLLLIQVFVFILALHLLQIGIWAGFYVRWGAVQDFEIRAVFLYRELCNSRLRGCRVAAAVAFGGRDRRYHRHSAIRLVDRFHL